MLHFSYPTPASYWRKLDQYSQAWAKQRYLEGKKTSMLRAAMSGFAAFIRTYFFRLGFLDGALGFAVCTMQAQSAFGKYFTLYCLNLKNK
jgi:(heptosyl)LPS beta-1,4-glucosyltransferase